MHVLPVSSFFACISEYLLFLERLPKGLTIIPKRKVVPLGVVIKSGYIFPIQKLSFLYFDVLIHFLFYNFAVTPYYKLRNERFAMYFFFEKYLVNYEI